MEIIEKMKVRVKRDGLARRAAGVGNGGESGGSGRKASTPPLGRCCSQAAEVLPPAANPAFLSKDLENQVMI